MWWASNTFVDGFIDESTRETGYGIYSEYLFSAISDYLLVILFEQLVKVLVCMVE